MNSLTTRVVLCVALTTLISVGNIAGLGSTPATHSVHNHISALSLLQTLDNSLPPEWAGIWESNNITYDCETGLETGRQTSRDTLCTGDQIVGDPEGNFTCTGTATATTIDVSCSVSIEQFPGCFSNFDVRTFGTRTGDTAEVTTVVRFSFTGCAFPSTCDSTVAQSTRIAPELPDCTSPVDPVTWGELKIKYR